MKTPFKPGSVSASNFEAYRLKYQDYPEYRMLIAYDALGERSKDWLNLSTAQMAAIDFERHCIGLIYQDKYERAIETAAREPR